MAIGCEMDDQIFFLSLEFTFCHRAHTVSGANKACYPKGVEDFFPAGKESRA
jgi:hypothetical protein